MKQSWKEVWSRRTPQKELDLAALIALDGFDSGAGRIEVDDWRVYAEIISQKLGLEDGQSVYEVGCGSGAFLYALREKYRLSLGGLDYAPELIRAACEVMPEGDFFACEATELCSDSQYDFVVSNGMFHYFNQQYAAKVLEGMIRKARIGVAVLEVPDAETKDEAETLRRDSLSSDEYEKKYAGLEHTYYARDWFNEQARQHGIICDVFDGCVPNYSQNCFRFGCIMFKASP